MVASVWFSRSIFTPSLASTAWCKPVRPAAALHQAAGEVVDDDHFAVLHDVMMIELVKRVRLQGLLDAMEQVHIRRVVKIADAQKTSRPSSRPASVRTAEWFFSSSR